MGLEMLYNEMIMEHARNRENHHALEGRTHEEHGHNPSCGDDLTLHLRVVENRIEEASFVGSGCAISMASASMMIDLIRGESLEKALEKTEAFLGMILGANEQSDHLQEIKEEELLEDAVLLKNIRYMPARVKCAVLAWHTLKEALVKN